MKERETYPSDASDEEWNFASLYLAFMTKPTAQRQYAFHKWFNTLPPKLGWADTLWWMLPNDFPPRQAGHVTLIEGGTFGSHRLVYARFFGSHKVKEANPVRWYWMDEDCHRLARTGLVLVVIDISTRKATRFIGHLLGCMWRAANSEERAQQPSGQAIQQEGADSENHLRWPKAIPTVTSEKTINYYGRSTDIPKIFSASTVL